MKECPWRVTTINPSGRAALKHYAVPFRYHDVLGLSKGGFLIGTYGTEEVLVPFIQAFRALPAVAFDDVPCAGDPLVKVRRKVFDGKTYLYAINTGDTPARVTLDVPPGTEDLVTGQRVTSPLTLDLQAYELRALGQRTSCPLRQRRER
ncbi:MAG: hypothetical protein II039_02365 [Treponema sp.]|nr:hypothetical protein [Treponema sp.]